jgi:hypothetical protein
MSAPTPAAAPRFCRLRCVCGFFAMWLFVFISGSTVRAQPPKTIGSPPQTPAPTLSSYSVDPNTKAISFQYNLVHNPPSPLLSLNPAGVNPKTITINYSNGSGTPLLLPIYVKLTFTPTFPVSGKTVSFMTKEITTIPTTPASGGGFAYTVDLTDVASSAVTALSARITSSFDPNNPNFGLGNATLSVIPVWPDTNGNTILGAPTQVVGNPLTITVDEVMLDPNALPQHGAGAAGQGSLVSGQDKTASGQDKTASGHGVTATPQKGAANKAAPASVPDASVGPPPVDPKAAKGEPEAKTPAWGETGAMPTIVKPEKK